ncbi:hypothetical protein [Lysinibacillus fusiformis]
MTGVSPRFQYVDFIYLIIQDYLEKKLLRFYGLMMQWIASGYKKSEEALIKDVIELTRTHIYAFEYIGKPLAIND